MAKPERSKMSVGDTIRLKQGAKNIAGGGSTTFASFVFKQSYTVMQIGLGSNPQADYIAFGQNGQYTGAVKIADIESVTYLKPPKTGGSSKSEQNKNKPTPKKPDNSGIAEAVGLIMSEINKSKGKEVGLASKSANEFVASDGYKYKVDTDGVEILDELKSNTTLKVPGTTTPINSSYDYSKVFNKYEMNYDSDLGSNENGSINSQWLDQIHQKHNICMKTSHRELFDDCMNHYNRFKIPSPNMALTKSFAHVFFTRPDLNILTRENGELVLTDQVKNNTNILYAFKRNPGLIRSLVLDNDQDHKFMLFLSNMAKTFSIQTEGLKSETYGETWTGHKIAYGKNNTEGKVAGNFNIDYTDTRNLDIYHLHKIWVDYIANVYRGIWVSKDDKLGKDGIWHHYADSYVANKILDYAVAAYYFLTAEDGETIIFWSKYYGVFPTYTSSNTFSWSSEHNLSTPNLQIEYQYSFKKDFDPLSLVEFNMLSGKPGANGYSYVPMYDESIMGCGEKMVGVPFIETQTDVNNPDRHYVYKLRFRYA